MAEAPRFRNIPQFTEAQYQCHTEWPYVEVWLEEHRTLKCGLELVPEFQRGHVWTEAQQIAYVEYRLRGGLGADVIYWNCPGWMGDWRGPMQLVDGLQRLTAVRRFLANELPIFGHLFREYADRLRLCRGAVFVFAVNDLSSYADILKWYIDLNSGGVVHSPEEIDRVRKLLEDSK
jgi:hypothetical protein